MAVVYKTINTINGKWYIGKDAANRPYYLGSGKALASAIKKYGKASFKKVILEHGTSLEQLAEREKYWINHTNAVSDPMSYNLAPGGEGGDRSKYIDYTSIDYSKFTMTGAIKWYKGLTDEEKYEHQKSLADMRSKVWYVSRIDDPTEIEIKNINEWCKINNVGSDTVSNLTNPSHDLFQKQTKGWRFRKEGQDPLPPYKNRRLEGHPNVACKGKSWKLVNGKRVWFNKEVK